MYRTNVRLVEHSHKTGTVLFRLVVRPQAHDIYVVVGYFGVHTYGT